MDPLHHITLVIQGNYLIQILSLHFSTLQTAFIHCYISERSFDLTRIIKNNYTDSLWKIGLSAAVVTF